MRRGEIYRLRLPAGRGREQRGARFGVVVQSDHLLPFSTVLVAPTSRSAAAASFRPQVVVDGIPTRVLVEQLRALDAGALGECSGRLEAGELLAVDDALERVLGLS